MTNKMENYIERTENRTNANLPKDNKKKQKEEKTQIDTKQVTPKHIENVASQQTPATLSTTKTNETKNLTLHLKVKTQTIQETKIL